MSPSPSSYDGDVVLFTTENQGSGKIHPPHLGWEGYVRDKHLTIFQEPHGHNLVQEVSQILANRV